MPSTTMPLLNDSCMMRATSLADSSETRTPTRYRAASMPAATPPLVITRRPPSPIAARRAIDSRRELDPLNEMEPFLLFVSLDSISGHVLRTGHWRAADHPTCDGCKGSHPHRQ